MNWYKLSNLDSNNQLELGIKIELEHRDTIRKIRGNPDISDEDAAKLIAKDHLSEIPDYYSRLQEMESQTEHESHNNNSERKK